MTPSKRSRSEKSAPGKNEPREPTVRKLSGAERKRYLATMKREAERHRRTLAALAKWSAGAHNHAKHDVRIEVSVDCAHDDCAPDVVTR